MPTDLEGMRVAVIVLNWNGLGLTRACLASLRNQTVRDMEVHVVDNGSTEDEAAVIAKEFPEVHVHALRANLGFTGGCNLVLRELLTTDRCAFAALLNNDTEAAPDWLQNLLVEATTEDVSVVASSMRLFHQPDLLDNAGVWLLSNGDCAPRGRNQPAAVWSRPDDLAAACGGAVLLRLSMLREIGVLRDDFFANFEDVDLCLRALVAGHRIRHAPRAVVRHHLNASIVRVRNRDFDAHSVRNATWATFVNLPWQVLLLDLPAFLIANLSIVCLTPLLGRPGVALAFLRGRLRALRELPTMLRERRRLRPLRRVPWWSIWRMQRSFWLEFLRMARAYLRDGRPSR